MSRCLVGGFVAHRRDVRVELVGRVRRSVRVAGRSQREVAGIRDLRKTIQKMLHDMNWSSDSICPDHSTNDMIERACKVYRSEWIA